MNRLVRRALGSAALVVVTGCDPEPSSNQALGIDHLEIVGGATFASFADVANNWLGEMILDGRLLLALDFRGLDDPSGQDDTEVALGYFPAADPDADPADNFDADHPDEWNTAAEYLDDAGNPLITFPDATLVGGALIASSPSPIAFPGLPIELRIDRPSISGVVTASTDQAWIVSLGDGTIGATPIEARLAGTVTASTLASLPNLIGALGCPGNTLLDAFVLGCAGNMTPSQPDTDLDGDGLEHLCDVCGDPLCPVEGGAGGDADGLVDCCADGDGTIIVGSTCWADPRVADGFALELAIHATRIFLRADDR